MQEYYDWLKASRDEAETPAERECYQYAMWEFEEMCERQGYKLVLNDEEE